MKKECVGVFLISIILWNAVLSAQQPYRVISNTGLKLREQPDRNSPVLAIAPFGAEVQVLSNKRNLFGYLEFDPPARCDTIGTFIPTPGQEKNRSSLHIGYWWKVRYTGKEGYMFSGFLADSALLHRNHGGAELNNRFRLRQFGGNLGASNSPEFDPNWYWYGVFPEENGSFTLKEVHLRYAVEDNSETPDPDALARYKQVVTQTDQTKQPALILGTRERRKERPGIEGFWIRKAPLAQFDPKTHALKPDFLKKYGIEVQKETVNPEGRYPYEVLNWYITGDNGQKQLVTPLGPYPGFQMGPSALAWAGDLDGDGKLDYIFEAYGEIGYSVLYLSSLAGKGELARPAAVLWNWYTC